MSRLRCSIQASMVFGVLICALGFGADLVAPQPLVQGFVAGMGADADGNRYLTGSYYEAQDFNPGTGEDTKTPVGWTDLFVTRYNADGAYAWTQTLGAKNGTTIGVAATAV